MRIGDIKQINEASTLSGLGVSHDDIAHIHSELHLKHDVEYNRITNKDEAKAAVLHGRVVIAVNDQGRAIGFGQHGGKDVRVARRQDLDQSEDWHADVMPISKAMSKVTGSG